MIGTLAFASFAQSSTIYTYQLTFNDIPAPRPGLPELYSKEYLLGYVGKVSIQYELSDDQYQQLRYVVEHESSWNIFAYNKADEKYVKGGSRGVLQFTIPTWRENCLEFAKTRDESPLAQISCGAKMFKQNMQSRWSSWCKKFGIGFKACHWINKK